MAHTININERQIGPNQATFFIAEEGQMNQGNLDVALKMIDTATQAGADAIEFQLAIANDFYVPSHPLHAVYTRRQFELSQMKALFDYASEKGIIAQASPLSCKLPEKLAHFGCQIFNITSSDINNPDMIDAVAETGRPFLMSTAMATLKEVDWAVNRALQVATGRFGLLHGQHIMFTGTGQGVPESETSLRTIRFFHERYGCPIGFIDHTSNPFMPALAVASGACMVTKHFTYDRKLQGPDWHICLEPEELKETIRMVRLTDTTRGEPTKILARGEASDQREMRRSIVATQYLSAGTILNRHHICFKRPGTGLAPTETHLILGKKLNQTLSPNDQILLNHIEQPSRPLVFKPAIRPFVHKELHLSLETQK